MQNPQHELFQSMLHILSATLAEQLLAPLTTSAFHPVAVYHLTGEKSTESLEKCVPGLVCNSIYVDSKSCGNCVPLNVKWAAKDGF